MFLSKAKFNELTESVKSAQNQVETLKRVNQEQSEIIKDLRATIADYENTIKNYEVRADEDACECEDTCDCDTCGEQKRAFVAWANEYIANDLKAIYSSKLRAFVSGQIALELGTPVPTEFTTDIDDNALENIKHILYAAVTLDSYLGAEGLTIRKK